MQDATPEDKKAALEQLLKNFDTHQMKAAPEAALAGAPAAATPANALNALPAPAAMPAGALAALNTIFAKGSHGDASADSGGDDQADTGGLNAALVGAGHVGRSDGLKGDFQAAMAKAPGQPQPMAVPELVQQAQLMVRDGGGDMKVTLHPDGLGEVALRVSVTDGKVNVQMVTQSDEAKHLIERQLGDLKNGLSNNHLQVDSIKVDTATNLGKQLDQQYQDAQRQQAQQSLAQFRQDGGGAWRRSFL